MTELSFLIDALPGLIWTALPDGNIDFLNRRWCDYTGLASDQAVGSGWQSAIHPDDLVGVFELWRSLGANGRRGEVQARLRRHDGQYRRFLMSAVPITDESGRIVKWCGLNVDVEERVQAEETARLLERGQADLALRASEGQLRRAAAQLIAAQQLSKTGSFTADVGADEHVWSDELYRICEFEPGSTVTIRRIREIVDPEDLPIFDQSIEAAVSGIAPAFVFRIKTAHGAVKHLRAIASADDQNGGRTIFVGAIQDITESKLAEGALRARETELQWSLRHLTEAQALGKTGSFNADTKRDQHFWSDGFYNICEIEPGTTIKNQTLLDLVVPADVPQFIEILGLATAGIAPPPFGFRIVTPRAGVKHLRGVARCFDDGSSDTMFLGAVQDVTENKLAEDALRALQLELEHANRLATLGQLVASIAHEINQPIGAVRNNAHAALRFLAGDPPDLAEVTEALACMVSETYRVGEIIDRIREQVRKSPPRKEMVDLNEAIEAVIAIVRGELSKHHVSARVLLEDGAPPVQGDRVQLQQVMLNLILNAIEAMISLEDDARELVISTQSSPAEGLLVAISDSGPGVAAEIRERIFESFYTTKGNGLGIGLSICRSIVNAHAGRLWVEPRQPRGAVFRLTLPAHG
jgi:PAS domain S-box-containing protein